MVLTRFAKALLGFCFALPGCLLPEINVRPEVEIEAAEASSLQSLVRSGSQTFTARVRGGNTNKLSFQWGHVLGDCPQPLDTSNPATSPSPDPSYPFSPEPGHMGMVCIWVLVTDSKGATGLAFTTIKIQNQAPKAALMQVSPPAQSPVRLGTVVRIDAIVADPDPEDVAQPELRLTAPDGEDVEMVLCEETEPTQWCFAANVSGVWKAQLVAHDPLGARSEPASLEIKVEGDQPPCVHGTPASAILVHEAALPLLLEARVIDDLDSLPALDNATSRASLKWSVWENEAEGWLLAVDNVQRAFRIPGDRFRPADRVRIRVEVADRMPRALPQNCGLQSDECAWAPLCKQRLTWTVEFR